MSSAALQQLVAKLPEPLRRDPKKTLALGVLMVVALGVGGRQLWPESGPSPAAAAATSAKSDVAPDRRGKSASANANPARAGRSDQIEAWLARPVKAPSRNLFALQAEFLPRADESHAAAAAAGADDLFWDRLAKSVASRADQRRQRQIRLENLQLAAGKVRLQSTILTGGTPRALIDGRLRKLGDAVTADPGGLAVAFRIVRVEARRVVLERDGVRVEVPMGTGRVQILRGE